MNEVNLQEVLRGLEYPKDKMGIIEYARNKNAGQETLGLLQKLPDKEYQNPISLAEEINKIR